MAVHFCFRFLFSCLRSVRKVEMYTLITADTKCTCWPNFGEISQFTAEILQLPVSENKCPPCWNVTSGFNFHVCVIIGVPFCICLPFFRNQTTRDRVKASYLFFKMAANFRRKGVLPSNNWCCNWCQKTRVTVLSFGIKNSAASCTVWLQFTNVTDRQTDGRTDVMLMA